MSLKSNLSKSQEDVLRVLRQSKRVVAEVILYRVVISGELGGVELTCDLLEFNDLVRRGLVKRLYGDTFIATQLELF